MHASDGGQGPPYAVEIPVEGGSLAAEIRGPAPGSGAPLVVLAHGITANAASWRLVTARLDGIATVAVDLRGRGGSCELPGPWGMGRHAADLVAVLDHYGADTAIVVGHSMGAFVATSLAVDHPHRLTAAVLVDGGVPLPRPEGVDPGEALDALLGPATARLSMTFASREDYYGFWRSHPAFADHWNSAIEAYLDHDLGGRAPKLSPRVNEAAVRADGAELLLDDDRRDAVFRMRCPVELLRVDRGIMDDHNPIVPIEQAEAAARAAGGDRRFRVTTVPDLNHYTITLSPAGADAVAEAVRRTIRQREAPSASSSP